MSCFNPNDWNSENDDSSERYILGAIQLFVFAVAVLILLEVL